MKFSISAASYHFRGDEPQPCSKAYRVAADSNNEEYWCVEINSLEELMALVTEVEAEVIVNSDNHITIYNDYVE